MASILWIEDDERKMFRYFECLKMGGHDLICLNSADDALVYFDQGLRPGSIDLAIIDLGMYTAHAMTERETGFGRLTGYALLQRLRTCGYVGPVIVLSNSSDDIIRNRVEKGGNWFFRKVHTTPQELRRYVALLLSGGSA